jgi:hypothetical protein
MSTVSYAGVISSASPPPQITLPNLLPKQPPPAAARLHKPPSWNPGPRGIDVAIPINQAALEAIKKRKDNNKLCNNHYLRGPCAKGDACCFEHRYKPSKDEINAIAFLARLNPCTNGQDCEVEDCIYGHHVSPTSGHHVRVWKPIVIVPNAPRAVSARALRKVFASTLIASLRWMSTHRTRNLKTTKSTTTRTSLVAGTRHSSLPDTCPSAHSEGDRQLFYTGREKGHHPIRDTFSIRLHVKRVTSAAH